MITSTKSVKCLLGWNIGGGAIAALAGIGNAIEGLSHGISSQGDGFAAGYTVGVGIGLGIFGAWIWFNCYAWGKLNKLRREAEGNYVQNRTFSPSAPVV